MRYPSRQTAILVNGTSASPAPGASPLPSRILAADRRIKLSSRSTQAGWMKPRPSTRTPWQAGPFDVSALRFLLDFPVFICHEDAWRRRITGSGDLNMILGVTGSSLWRRTRVKTVCDRPAAPGLVFPGPQARDERRPSAHQPAETPNTKNVPTWVHSQRDEKKADSQVIAFSPRAGSMKRFECALSAGRTSGSGRPLPPDD